MRGAGAPPSALGGRALAPHVSVNTPRKDLALPFVLFALASFFVLAVLGRPHARSRPRAPAPVPVAARRCPSSLETCDAASLNDVAFSRLPVLRGRPPTRTSKAEHKIVGDIALEWRVLSRRAMPMFVQVQAARPSFRNACGDNASAFVLSNRQNARRHPSKRATWRP